MERWIYEKYGITVQTFASLEEAKERLSPFFADQRTSNFCWEELDDNGVYKGILLHNGHDTGFRLYRPSALAEDAAVAA